MMSLKSALSFGIRIKHFNVMDVFNVRFHLFAPGFDAIIHSSDVITPSGVVSKHRANEAVFFRNASHF